MSDLVNGSIQCGQYFAGNDSVSPTAAVQLFSYHAVHQSLQKKKKGKKKEIDI